LEKGDVPVADTNGNFFVPLTARLFFSDDPPPEPEAGINQVFSPGMAPVALAGMLGSDGSPVTSTHLKEPGPLGGSVATWNGLTGTSKDGHKYELSLTSDGGDGVGRTPVKVSWAFSHMTFTKDTETVEFSFGFSAASALLLIALSHKNVNSTLLVDLSEIDTNDGVNFTGSAELTRRILYYTVPFCTQSTSMPAADTQPGMILPSSPLGPFIEAISYFAPALKYVVGQLGKASLPAKVPSAIASLNAFNPALKETAPQFLAVAMPFVAPALPLLAASLADTLCAGLTDAAYWIGWTLGQGLGKADLVTSLEQYYLQWEIWAQDQGATFRPLPRWPMIKTGITPVVNPNLWTPLP
jgi:hypothetical protein